MMKQIQIKVGNLVMMKSGDIALVVKVTPSEVFYGDKRNSFIEIQYSNGVVDSCSGWRVKELISG